MRLVICDDHPIVVISMTMLFEAHGHEVVATTDSPHRLPQLVAELQPDVCLLDFMFDGSFDATPALDAIELIAGATDVVVISGTADATQRAAALAAGASAVASKATAGDSLVALVEGRCPVAQTPSVPRASNPYRLTAREQQVLQSLINGDSTARMAQRLQMRHATARSHVQSLLLKMGVHTRSAAVAIGVRDGLAVFSG